MHNSLAVAKKIQDVLREPSSEKERVEVYLRVLGAYLQTVAQINQEYNKELRESLIKIKKVKEAKARLV